MELISLPILISTIAIAASAGFLGSFALLRRMALVSDALSHIALPGIALGIIFHFDLLIGSLIFLLLGVLIIWAIEHKTKLSVDTLVGVLYTLALALGAILVPGEEILDAMFGDISHLGTIDFWIVSLSSVAVILILIAFSKKFILSMISKDLARSKGLKPHLLELFFLLIFALTVAIGIKFIGALLMGSLVIIPAATARNLAHNFKSYAIMSAVFGVISAVLGIILAEYYNVSPGPIVVIIASALFFFSIFFRRK